ncbi:hypothetical protein K449DRAFT_143329 [Hypoxylon sp. EC38]|nr:hypothetical protein K449DRAFT_143329 [Hypoxylon sp. EC38]
MLPTFYLTSLLLPLYLWLLNLSHKSWIHSANKKKKGKEKKSCGIADRIRLEKTIVFSHDPERITAPCAAGHLQKVLHIIGGRLDEVGFDSSDVALDILFTFQHQSITSAAIARSTLNLPIAGREMGKSSLFHLISSSGVGP